MAHFAIIEKGIVVQVVVVDNSILLDKEGNEIEQKGIDFLTELIGANEYKQTSYNGNMRKNYAGVGFIYDSRIDEFVKPEIKDIPEKFDIK